MVPVQAHVQEFVRAYPYQIKILIGLQTFGLATFDIGLSKKYQIKTGYRTE
jgi:hypothetical protein